VVSSSPRQQGCTSSLPNQNLSSTMAILVLMYGYIDVGNAFHDLLAGNIRCTVESTEFMPGST
jgi:hypothetical protein